jgi:hypothetical protein
LRWNRGWLFFAALAAAAACATPAGAQVDQGRALTAIEACKDIEAALSAAKDSAAAPRLSGGEFGDEYAAALDLSIVGEIAPGPAGLALLLDLQREAGALIRSYLLLGIDAKALSSDPSGEQAARNFLDFLPEMAALYDYRVRVGSIISDAAAALPGPKPEPRISLAVAAIATEQEKVLLSAIAVASDQQIDAQWRAERVAALDESVSGFTKLMGRKKAQQIADTALIAARAETDPAVALLLKNFALALLR